MIGAALACLLTGLQTAAAVFAQGGDDPLAEGVRAYREGRFGAALAAFTAEVARRGETVPPELFYNQSLAALAAGELGVAATAAERARAGGGEFERRCAFLSGSIAWARGEKAAALAARPEAEPFLFEQAIRQIDAARAAWQQAALGDDDWPAARRNVERALRRLAALRQEQKRQEELRRKAGAQDRPQLVPTGESEGNDAPRAGGTETEERAPAPLSTELSAAEVAGMFAWLEQKEQQKRALRRSRQQRASAGVERDW